MLIPRDPVVLGEGLKRTRVPWRRLLADHEQSFLTDNQLSVFIDRHHPGCSSIHFYPLPFPHVFTGGRWNFEELVNHDSLRSVGPRLDLPVDQARLTFRPHRLDKTMRAGKNRLKESSAISGNTLVIEWELPGLQEVPLRFALPHFAAHTEPLANGVLVSVRDQVFVALVISGAASVGFTTHDDPFECQARVVLAASRLSLALACGYDRYAVIGAAQAVSANPAQVFASAEQMWDDYFTRLVPRFACSDTAIEKLYYYQAYTTLANLYDVPYEPFTRPYTCPWKTGAVWQWSWNTPLNSIAERWLNDKQIGAGGILLEADNGGALNIGTYLRPVQKVAELRSHNAHNRQVGEYLKAMPAGVDLAPLTTLPHTTPNGLLGAWELYLCSGDTGFLRQALALMREAEIEFSRHMLDNGLCTCSFVDEFDYSLRLKPFIAGFKKGDPEMMLKMDTPFIAVDYNCYLHVLRERMIQSVQILGDSAGLDVDRLRARNVQLKTAINRHLWNEQDAFYYDANPLTLQHSGVKCIAGFSALYAGIADERQAAQLVAHLTNPAEFGTPYPCPSISMDTLEVDPALITYGGDCLMTSGLWFTVEGLVRYGYRELAARYILKAIEMVNLEGPSSSYSYHSITGHYNQDKHTLAAQCAVLTDLLCRYVVGLQPRLDGDLAVDPLALADSSVQWLAFGPYRYRDREIVVRWDRATGVALDSIPQRHAAIHRQSNAGDKGALR